MCLRSDRFLSEPVSPRPVYLLRPFFSFFANINSKYSPMEKILHDRQRYSFIFLQYFLSLSKTCPLPSNIYIYTIPISIIRDPQHQNLRIIRKKGYSIEGTNEERINHCWKRSLLRYHTLLTNNSGTNAIIANVKSWRNIGGLRNSEEAHSWRRCAVSFGRAPPPSKSRDVELSLLASAPQTMALPVPGMLRHRGNWHRVHVEHRNSWN